MEEAHPDGQRLDADHGLPLLLVLDVLDRFGVELVDVLEHLGVGKMRGSVANAGSISVMASFVPSRG